MFTTKRNPFCFMLCFLLTLFTVQCLPLIVPNQIVCAEENTVKDTQSPSFTVKGENINITTVKPESNEKQSGQNTTGDQPKLVIDSSSHDVGDVWEGEEILHPFIIKNTGTAQLDIKNVKAG